MDKKYTGYTKSFRFKFINLKLKTGSLMVEGILFASKMSSIEIIPLTKDELRSLKAQEDERIRLEKERIRLERIADIVKNIYHFVIGRAKRTTDTSVSFHFEHYFKTFLVLYKKGLEHYDAKFFQEQKEFWDTNISDIEASVMGLFPNAVRLEEKNTLVVDWS